MYKYYLKYLNVAPLEKKKNNFRIIKNNIIFFLYINNNLYNN